MMFRLFQIFAIAFWLGTVVWLAASIFAPPESRMHAIDPEEAYRSFFTWNESTNMTLLENGKRRGQITISGGSGDDPDLGIFLNSLSLSGTIDSAKLPGSEGALDFFWRGVLDFTEELQIYRGDFSVRLPSKGFSAHMAMSGEPMTLKARAVVDRMPIFEYDGSKTAAPPAMPPMAQALLPMAGAQSGGALNPSGWKVNIDVRRGQYNLAGRNLPVYLLTLKFPEYGQEVRAFLSRAGEPLRIETDFGYEAVSEMLVPLDAYKKTGKDTKQDD